MTRRVPRDVRRGDVLHAAMRAFARTGYHGTTTAEVAREAGISQGYVMHLFGNKEALFLAALERAGDTIVDQMKRIRLQEFELDRFTETYGRTVLDETTMFVLLQGFATSSVPAVGAYVRGLLAEMYQVLIDDADATPEEARDYLARGLLINTVLAMGYRDHADEYPWVGALIQAVLTDGPGAAEPSDGSREESSDPAAGEDVQLPRIGRAAPAGHQHGDE